MKTATAHSAVLTVLLALSFTLGMADIAGADDPVRVDHSKMPPLMKQFQTASEVTQACLICHSDAGAEHQAAYDELYQDGVIQVTDLAYSFSAPDTSTVTFNITKNGAPYDATKADSIGIYFAPYTGTNFQFEPAAERQSLMGDLTCDGAGACTSTLVGEAPDVSNTPGLIVLYGRDEVVGQLPARVRLTKYPFAALLETGGGVDYTLKVRGNRSVKEYLAAQGRFKHLKEEDYNRIQEMINAEWELLLRKADLD